MKLLLRRDQHANILGTVTFKLSVRAELTDEERTNVTRYKLGSAMLYEKYTMLDRGSGLLGFFWRLFHRARNLSISVNDLAYGKRIDCKDIVEMLAIEEHIKEAARVFRAILEAARTFGGEEVVKID